jgi:hypothetical protein
MISLKIKTALIGAAASVLTASAGQAAMLPAPGSAYSSPDVQLAWCAAGFRLGPLGACIAGGPGPVWHGPGWRGHCWINRWGNRVCN